MTNDDNIQRELEGLLADVEPSRAFAARVRATIAAERGLSCRRLLGGRWVVLSAFGALTVLACAFAAERASVRVQPTSIASVSSVRPTAAVSVVPVARAMASPRQTESRLERAHPASSASSVEPGSNEVLVPDNERLALVHLLQGLKEGRADVPSTLGPRFDADGLLLPPEPVVIAPLPELASPDLEKLSGKLNSGTPGGDAR